MAEAYFPLFINMDHRRVLIVGAGAVGARRARVLAEFGTEVTVVAPAGTPEMERLEAEFGREAAETELGRETPGAKAQQKVPEAARGSIRWLRRAFRESDIREHDIWEHEIQEHEIHEGDIRESGHNRPDFVIAATDDDELNGRIVKLCREAGIPVNHAGDKSQCDFFFPGIAREGNLVVGVSASGESHGLTRRAAAQLRQWLGRFCEEERKNQ